MVARGMRRRRQQKEEKAGKKESKPVAAHERDSVSSTSPREIIDSQRGNDVVNTTVAGTEPSQPRPPSLGATFLRFFPRNPVPPLFPSRLPRPAASN